MFKSGSLKHLLEEIQCILCCQSNFCDLHLKAAKIIRNREWKWFNNTSHVLLKKEIIRIDGSIRVYHKSIPIFNVGNGEQLFSMPLYERNWKLWTLLVDISHCYLLRSSKWNHILCNNRRSISMHWVRYGWSGWSNTLFESFAERRKVQMTETWQSSNLYKDNLHPMNPYCRLRFAKKPHTSRHCDHNLGSLG